MTEHTGSIAVEKAAQDICQCVHEVANVIQVPSSTPDMYMFAAKTLATETDTLVTLVLADHKVNITVNCEKMVIGSMLLKNISTALSKL